MQHDFETWLDNHISPIIAKWLMEETNYIVKSSYVLKLYGLSDLEIYKKAQANERLVIIISKDTDLDEIISLKGSPPKLILLRIGNCDNRILFSFIIDNIENAIKLITTFKNKDIIELNKL
jgi:predicted nuclease of predicted toxin-antitoxin system